MFNEALVLAQATGASLMLLHVLSSEEEGSPDIPILRGMEYYPALRADNWEFYQKQWRAYETQGLDLLRTLTDEASLAGVRTEFTQISGNPGRTICNFARTWAADLIIMGRRGRSGLTELIMGSVSNYTLHHAPCSVLTVQHTLSSITQTAIDQTSQVSA